MGILKFLDLAAESVKYAGDVSRCLEYHLFGAVPCCGVQALVDQYLKKLLAFERLADDDAFVLAVGAIAIPTVFDLASSQVPAFASDCYFLGHSGPASMQSRWPLTTL